VFVPANPIKPSLIFTTKARKYPSVAVANCIKLFWRNWALSFGSGYATRGVNYAEKCFMKLAAGLHIKRRFSNLTTNFGRGLVDLILYQRSLS